MAISGITTTANNGVERITNKQTITGIGTADGETLVLDGGTSTLETGTSTGTVTITNCQVKLDSDTPTGNDAAGAINYGGRTITTTTMAFRDSLILCGPFTGRHNIQVTELTRTKVIEADNTGEMFVYTGTDAIIDDVLFRGINVWEVFAPPSILFNVIVDAVDYAYLNWEGGRLDFFSFVVSNIGIAHAWHGTGNTGNNFVYQWNPDVSWDPELMYLTDTNNRVYIGYTATWRFADRDTGSSVEDALLIFNDDRTGSSSELGRFTTNSSGILTGTYDSQNNSSGGNIERPTLFIQTLEVESVDEGSPGAFTFPVSVIGGDQGNRQANYDIDTITPEIEIRSYLHESPTGFAVGDSFTPTEEIGAIASDLSVTRFQDFLLPPDAGITVNKTTADAYSGLADLEQLFDRTKAEWRDNDGFPLPMKNGVILDFGATNLVLDGNAGSTFAFAGNTITVDTSTSSIPPISLVGTTESISSGEDDEITIAFPGGIADDDFAIIIVGHAQSDENAWNTPTDWAIPTGLTEVQTGGSPASIPGISVFTKVLSSDSGSVTITNVGTNISGIVAQMRVYRNVDTSVPIDVNSTTASNATGDPNPPSITSVNDGSMIIAIGFQDDGDQADPTVPAGYGNLVSTATLDGAGTGE